MVLIDLLIKKKSACAKEFRNEILRLWVGSLSNKVANSSFTENEKVSRKVAYLLLLFNSRLEQITFTGRF